MNTPDKKATKIVDAFYAPFMVVIIATATFNVIHKAGIPIIPSFVYDHHRIIFTAIFTIFFGTKVTEIMYSDEA